MRVVCTTGKRTGTCDATDCPSHGLCHCGCGSVTKLSTHNHVPSAAYPNGMTRYQPYMHRAGHTKASLQGLNDPGHYRHGWYEDASRARELIDLLVTEHGSLTAAARRAKVSRDTLVRLRNGRLDRVWPQTMAKLERAWRKADRPAVSVYLPVQPLREFMARVEQHPLSQGEAFERRFYRDKISLALADETATALGVHPSAIWPEFLEIA